MYIDPDWRWIPWILLTNNFIPSAKYEYYSFNFCCCLFCCWYMCIYSFQNVNQWRCKCLHDGNIKMIVCYIVIQIDMMSLIIKMIAIFCWCPNRQFFSNFKLFFIILVHFVPIFLSLISSSSPCKQLLLRLW